MRADVCRRGGTRRPRRRGLVDHAIAGVARRPAVRARHPGAHIWSRRWRCCRRGAPLRQPRRHSTVKLWTLDGALEAHPSTTAPSCSIAARPTTRADHCVAPRDASAAERLGSGCPDVDGALVHTLQCRIHAWGECDRPRSTATVPRRGARDHVHAWGVGCAERAAGRVAASEQAHRAQRRYADSGQRTRERCVAALGDQGAIHACRQQLLQRQRRMRASPPMASSCGGALRIPCGRRRRRAPSGTAPRFSPDWASRRSGAAPRLREGRPAGRPRGPRQARRARTVSRPSPGAGRRGIAGAITVTAKPTAARRGEQRRRLRDGRATASSWTVAAGGSAARSRRVHRRSRRGARVATAAGDRPREAAQAVDRRPQPAVNAARRATCAAPARPAERETRASCRERPNVDLPERRREPRGASARLSEYGMTPRPRLLARGTFGARRPKKLEMETAAARQPGGGAAAAPASCAGDVASRRHRPRRRASGDHLDTPAVTPTSFI